MLNNFVVMFLLLFIIINVIFIVVMLNNWENLIYDLCMFLYLLL